MKLLLTTPDVGCHFRPAIKALSVLEKLQLRMMSEELSRRSDSALELVRRIIDSKPDLIITKNKDLAESIAQADDSVKIILLSDCGLHCERQLLSNALVVTAFLRSKAQTFSVITDSEALSVSQPV